MMLTAMPQYDAYKNSGIEWLGDIPKHWLLKKAKYLLSEVNIRSESGNERLLSLSKYHGMVPKDSLEERSGGAASLIGYKKVSVNQLVINKMQAVNGLLAVSSLEGITSPDYSVYEAKDVYTTNIKYIEYLLTQPEYLAEFKRRVTGVMDGFIRLYTDDLFAIKIIHPPLEEQARLVSFLDEKTAKIDEAIAIKAQQISLLRERMQILIQQAVTQGLDPTVPMKDSGVKWIGKIPEHWAIKQARYLFRVVRRNIRNGNEIKFSVTQKNGLVPTDEMKENSTQAESFDSFQLCHENDLVLNKYKAHLGVFWRAYKRGIITNNYTVFTPLKDTLTKYYEILFHTSTYVSEFRSIVYGVTEGMMPLYTNDFYSLETICPPFEEQKSIALHVMEIEKTHKISISLLMNQIETLNEYKTTLINSAVTGKIKVV